MIFFDKPAEIDVLMCVGSQDIERFFSDSLLSCWRNFSALSHIYIISPNKKLIEKKLEEINRPEICPKITLLSDEEVLDTFVIKQAGWYRQQVIKLNAHKICNTKLIACLSSDTVILQKLEEKDYLSNLGVPILYYRNHNTASNSYLFEKSRILDIETILQAELNRSKALVDFILDFTIWDSKILSQLDQYLLDLYGPEKYKVIKPSDKDLASKKGFGEWSLYASFVLDILKKEEVITKSFEKDYFFQINNQKDLNNFKYNSKIVHIVSKKLDYRYIKSQLDNVFNSSV